MVHVVSTRHFFERCHERRLAREVLNFILLHGMELRARGATHLTVLSRYLPPDERCSALAQRARDWIVMLDDAGQLLTCYRRRHASRYLRRKPKTRQRSDRRCGHRAEAGVGRGRR